MERRVAFDLTDSERDALRARLHLWMVEHGYTHERVAALIGVRRCRIKQFMGGERRTSADTLRKLIGAIPELGVGFPVAFIDVSDRAPIRLHLPEDV